MAFRPFCFRSFVFLFSMLNCLLFLFFVFVLNCLLFSVFFLWFLSLDFWILSFVVYLLFLFLVVFWLLSFVFCFLSFVFCFLSLVFCLSSSVFRPLSFVFFLSFAFCFPLSTCVSSPPSLWWKSRCFLLEWQLQVFDPRESQPLMLNGICGDMENKVVSRLSWQIGDRLVTDWWQNGDKLVTALYQKQWFW